MADNTKSVLPGPSEKLSYKFILDSLKDQILDDGTAEETVPLTLESKAEEKTLEALSEVLCGTESEDSKTQLELMSCEPELAPELTEEPELDAQTAAKPLELQPGKKYFRIGEVSELIGVEPYVLRYWESEFSSVRPVKSTSGHRVYSRKDVETLYRIRQLLHVEKFSIKGAKKKLSERKKEVEAVALPDRQILKDLSRELKDLVQIIRNSPF